MYCKARVYSGSGFHAHGCSRKAVKDGYCKIHHPDSVKARREKSEKSWKEQSEKERQARIAHGLKLATIEQLEAELKLRKSPDERSGA